MTQPSPIVTPGITVTAAPSQQPAPIRVVSLRFAPWRRSGPPSSCVVVSRITRIPIAQFGPTMILPPPSKNTEVLIQLPSPIVTRGDPK